MRWKQSQPLWFFVSFIKDVWGREKCTRSYTIHTYPLHEGTGHIVGTVTLNLSLIRHAFFSLNIEQCPGHDIIWNGWGSLYYRLKHRRHYGRGIRWTNVNAIIRTMMLVFIRQIVQFQCLCKLLIQHEGVYFLAQNHYISKGVRSIIKVSACKSMCVRVCVCVCL